MADFGLVIYNDNNRIMFDSRNEMHSYVVSEVGTGTGPSDYNKSEGDYLFVSPPAGQANAIAAYVIFAESSFDLENPGFTFKGYNLNSGGTPDTLTLDYFVVKQSKNVSVGSDTYGLVINNDDSTVQFDSRSVQTGNHFSITSYTQPNSTICFTTSTGGVDLGSSLDYWDISWSAGVVNQFTTSITGINITADVLFYNFTTISGTTNYNRKNRTMILSADLV